MTVEPNHVYVIPPNADLAILQGVLHVMTPPRRPCRRAAICRSTTSSARWPRIRAPRSIGIVLSGTGTDGTFGLQGDQGGGRHHLRAGARRRRSTTACRAARSRAAGPTSAWRPTTSRRSCGSISQHPYLARTTSPAPQAQEQRRQAGRPDARRVRQRPHLLQADHRRPAHRAADGAAQDREARRLRQVRAGATPTSCACCTRTCSSASRASSATASRSRR